MKVVSLLIVGAAGTSFEDIAHKENAEHDLTLTYTGPDGTPRRMRTYSEPRAQPVKHLQGEADDLINIAKTAWNFIENSKPVVDLQANYGNAIPKGVDFQDLNFDKQESFDPNGPDGDNPDGTHHYVWTATFGNTRCELEFRNAWLAHGHRKGHDSSKEMFIDQATQVISQAYAKAGNKLQASVQVLGPTNVGEDGKVNAELTLQIAIDCNGVHGYHTFRIFGDGTSSVLQDEFLLDDAVAV
jgi:hypothetical protein